MLRDYVSLSVLAISIVFVGPLTACSDDSPAVDASVVIADSAPPDVMPFTCPAGETDCGGFCVNTNTDSLHCGGCNMACQSAGQICSGSLPCACPADFITETWTPVFDQVNNQADPILLGLSAFSSGTLNVFLVGYQLDTVTVGADIDLSMTMDPFVGAGYDVDIGGFTSKTNYFVTSGTLNLSGACPLGVHGTLTDAVFSEAAMDGTPVPNGCTMNVPLVTFSIGEDCPVPDGGIDAM